MIDLPIFLPILIAILILRSQTRLFRLRAGSQGHTDRPVRLVWPTNSPRAYT